jgi:hypothetical protein
MQTIILSQQVGWHGDKKFDLHPWGSKMKSHD